MNETGKKRITSKDLTKYKLYHKSPLSLLGDYVKSIHKEGGFSLYDETSNHVEAKGFFTQLLTGDCYNSGKWDYTKNNPLCYGKKKPNSYDVLILSTQILAHYLAKFPQHKEIAEELQDIKERCNNIKFDLDTLNENLQEARAVVTSCKKNRSKRDPKGWFKLSTSSLTAWNKDHVKHYHFETCPSSLMPFEAWHINAMDKLQYIANNGLKIIEIHKERVKQLQGLYDAARTIRTSAYNYQHMIDTLNQSEVNPVTEQPYKIEHVKAGELADLYINF